MWFMQRVKAVIQFWFCSEGASHRLPKRCWGAPSNMWGQGIEFGLTRNSRVSWTPSTQLSPFKNIDPILNLDTRITVSTVRYYDRTPEKQTDTLIPSLCSKLTFTVITYRIEFKAHVESLKDIWFI